MTAAGGSILVLATRSGAIIATENNRIEDGILIHETQRDTKLHEAVIPVSFVLLCVLRG